MILRLLLVPLLVAVAVAAAEAPTPADFVRRAVPSDEGRKAPSGSAVERRARLAERARSTYEHRFDLSGLPAYAPRGRVAGTIRVWGNNYLGDSGLSGRLAAAFAQVQPDARIEWVLPTAAVAVPGLYMGVADVGINHEPSFYDYLAHVRILGFEPTGFSFVTGSFDISGWQNCIAIVVHKDNPLTRITLDQLDGVFGSARAGGWVGATWHPEFARGAEKNLRTWGQLGLDGAWEPRRIQPYGYSLRYATALEFSNRVLKASDKWNEDLLAYGNYVSPEGQRSIQAEQIMERLQADPNGIAYIRWQSAFAGKVKVLAVAETAAGPFYDYTVENLQARRYPLWGDQSLWVSVKPGTTMDPKVAEFVRFLLSREGQQLVMEDGKYLPLNAEAATAELAKLARLE